MAIMRNMQYQTTRTVVSNIFESRLRDITMTHYQRLINYIDDLVLDKATREEDGWFLSFDDLDEDEQGQLVTLMLEYDDRDTSECFHQPDQYAKDDEITCSLIKMLNDNSPDNREDFANLVRKQSIKCYQSKLQEEIDDRCGWVRQEIQDSRGYDG
jgi:hypothetical protein